MVAVGWVVVFRVAELVVAFGVDAGTFVTDAGVLTGAAVWIGVDALTCPSGVLCFGAAEEDVAPTAFLVCAVIVAGR